MVLHLVLTYFNLFHILGLYDGTPDFSDNGLDAGHDAQCDALHPEGWLQYDPTWADGAGWVETKELGFGEEKHPEKPACGTATSDDEHDDGDWWLKIPPEGLQVGGRFYSRARAEWDYYIDGEPCF